MKPRILVTTTSFQDTPGTHHEMLADTGWEIIKERGPLSEADTLTAVGAIDGYICGDDVITRAVLERACPRLKVLSKYGIGVDKIDVDAATEMGLPLLFTPGVNHTTVAEHTFLLLLAIEKHLLFHADSNSAGWLEAKNRPRDCWENYWCGRYGAYWERGCQACKGFRYDRNRIRRLLG